MCRRPVRWEEDPPVQGVLVLSSLRPQWHPGGLQNSQYSRPSQSERGSNPSGTHAGGVVLDHLSPELGRDAASLPHWKWPTIIPTSHIGLIPSLLLALIENDQCCSPKVTTLARVQGSSM